MKKFINKEKNKNMGKSYFLKGLLIFLALGYDGLQMVIDDLIFPGLKDISYFDRPWYALVTHWSFVILVWCLTIVFFYRWMSKQEGTTKINIRFDHDAIRLIPWAIASSLVLAVIGSMIFDSELPQIAREYRLFVRDHGSMGWLVALFQNLYYLVESALVVILLGLMQSAGEAWFKKTSIVWGSIGLCLTWGIFHLFHGLPSAIWITFTAALIGIFYVKSKKNVWACFCLVTLLFFI